MQGALKFTFRLPLVARWCVGEANEGSFMAHTARLWAGLIQGSYCRWRRNPVRVLEPGTVVGEGLLPSCCTAQTQETNTHLWTLVQTKMTRWWQCFGQECMIKIQKELVWTLQHMISCCFKVVVKDSLLCKMQTCEVEFTTCPVFDFRWVTIICAWQKVHR